MHGPKSRLPALVISLLLLVGCDSAGDVPGPDIDTTALENADPIPALWTVYGGSQQLTGTFRSPCEVVSFNGRPAPTDSRWLATLTQTDIRVTQATYSTADGRCSGRGADIATYTLIATDNALTTVGEVAGIAPANPQNAAATGSLPDTGLANRLSVMIASTWLALPLGSRGDIALVIDDSLPDALRLYLDAWEGSGGFTGTLLWQSRFDPAP